MINVVFTCPRSRVGISLGVPPGISLPQGGGISVPCTHVYHVQCVGVLVQNLIVLFTIRQRSQNLISSYFYKLELVKSDSFVTSSHFDYL